MVLPSFHRRTSLFRRAGVAVGLALMCLAAVAAVTLLPRGRHGMNAREPEAAFGPGSADDWFAGQRMAPDGILHYESRAAALRTARDMHAAAASGRAGTSAELASV